MSDGASFKNNNVVSVRYSICHDVGLCDVVVT